MQVVGSNSPSPPPGFRWLLIHQHGGGGGRIPPKNQTALRRFLDYDVVHFQHFQTVTAHREKVDFRHLGVIVQPPKNTSSQEVPRRAVSLPPPEGMQEKLSKNSPTLGRDAVYLVQGGPTAPSAPPFRHKYLCPPPLGEAIKQHQPHRTP